MPKGQSQAQKQKQRAKKGAKKKKIVDPFLKKDWYVIKVPTWTQRRDDHYRVGFSPASKGKSRKALENRTFTINLGDLQNNDKQNANDDMNWKKFKFQLEETFGDKLLTQWYGMEITRDKRCSLIRKWHTMLECFCDAKTTDGYVLRIKALAFTKKQPTQIKKNCYAKNSQRHQIRAKMREIIKNHVSGSDLKSFVKKLWKTAPKTQGNDVIGNDIRKSCQMYFPLKMALIEKVKVVRKPKKDVARLMEQHELKHGFDPIKEDSESEVEMSEDEDYSTNSDIE